jgi:YjbE family integral membrane protein
VAAWSSGGHDLAVQGRTEGEELVGSLAQMLDPASWGSMVMTGWSDLGQATFWVAVVKIMWINVLLSGDNAVVIAMACRGLPHRQRLWGMIFGAGVAVVLRILFTGIVATLMLLPYLKLVGGLALFYIAAKLLVPEDPDEDEVEAVEHLWRAIRIVAIADIIMSLDNVIAIAAAAQGNMALLVLGLGISIPLIVAGAALIMALLDRFPVLVWAGAALLGWIVGEVIATDPAIEPLIAANVHFATPHQVEMATATAGAILVLLVGGLWRRSKQSSRPDQGAAKVDELARKENQPAE